MGKILQISIDKMCMYLFKYKKCDAEAYLHWEATLIPTVRNRLCCLGYNNKLRSIFQVKTLLLR